MRRSAADLVVIADDLSGAAESASAIARAHGGGVPVLLANGSGEGEIPVGVPIVIDTNTRSGAAASSSQTRRIDALLSERPVIVKKIDSLLRGGFAAETERMLRLGRPVIVSPALPAARRVVRDGRVLADGLPLAQTSTWALEPFPAPSSLPNAFSPRAAQIPLETVRGDAADLARAIAAPGGVVVCDAEHDADLRRIAEAALSLDPVPVLVGSSAIVAAVAGLLTPGSPDAVTPGSPDAVTPGAARAGIVRAAFVVGSAEPSARRQVDRLAQAGAHVLRLPAAELAEGVTGAHRAAVAAALRHPVSAISFDSPAFTSAHSAGLSRALAALLADAPARTPGTAFLLTGGQTARSILDAWGVRRILVHGDVDEGTAYGITDGGTTVATRPGSFGDEDSLRRISHELTREPTPAGKTTT